MQDVKETSSVDPTTAGSLVSTTMRRMTVVRDQVVVGGLATHQDLARRTGPSGAASVRAVWGVDMVRRRGQGTVLDPSVGSHYIHRRRRREFVRAPTVGEVLEEEDHLEGGGTLNLILENKMFLI